MFPGLERLPPMSLRSSRACARRTGRTAKCAYGKDETPEASGSSRPRRSGICRALATLRSHQSEDWGWVLKRLTKNRQKLEELALDGDEVILA